MIEFDDGAVTLPYDSLPADLQAQYPLGSANLPVADQRSFTGRWTTGFGLSGETVEFDGEGFA